jgi:hypothetical protein
MMVMQAMDRKFEFSEGLPARSKARRPWKTAMSIEAASAAALVAPHPLRRPRCLSSAPLLVTRLRIGDAASRSNRIRSPPLSSESSDLAVGAHSDDDDFDHDFSLSSSLFGDSALVLLVSCLLSWVLFAVSIALDTLLACAIACGFDFVLVAPSPFPRLIRGAARWFGASRFSAFGFPDDTSVTRNGNHSGHVSNGSVYRRRSGGGRTPSDGSHTQRRRECSASPPSPCPLPPLSFRRGFGTNGSYFERTHLFGRMSSSLRAHAWRAALCAYALWSCVGFGTDIGMLSD